MPTSNRLVDHMVFAQWHPTRNTGIDPTTLTRGMHRRVWWKCPNGHEWQATVISRARPTRPAGCPGCAREAASAKQTLVGTTRNPLSDHPAAAEWHPTRNGDLDPPDVAAGSRSTAWWLCTDCGHEWQARIAHRTAPQPSRCPRCSRATVGEESTSKAATANPLSNHAVVAEWHPTLNGNLSPKQVPAGGRLIVWWKCSTCNHEWQAKVTNRTRKESSGCPACMARQQGDRHRGGSFLQRETIADNRLLSEWNWTRNGAVRPEEITAGSHRKVWWLCSECGHEWQAEVAARTKSLRPAGCPECARRRKSEKARAAAAARNPLSAHPLAQEFHPSKNGALTPQTISASSAQKVWWLGECGHEWEASVHNRMSAGPRGRQTGCPTCAPDRIGPAKAAAAAAVNPLSAHSVATELHPTMNGGLTADQIAVGSHRDLWWLCPNGHAYRAQPHHRTRKSNPSGCPTCGAAAGGAAMREIRSTRHWS